MKIQYLSDLHLERMINYEFISQNINSIIVPSGEVLILAGDITKMDKLHYNDPIFDHLSMYFDKIFIVPGNHEYYYLSDLNKISQPFLNEDIRDNIHLVNNVSIDYKGVQFIFSTLWSHINEYESFYIERNVMDFNHIKKGKYTLSYKDFNSLHLDAKFFIVNALKDNKNTKTVVVTHHLPTKLVVHPDYKSSIISNAFVSENYDIIADNNIDYWIYGHSHRNIEDVKINNTILTCNQYGYQGYNLEFSGYNPKKIIEL